MTRSRLGAYVGANVGLVLAAAQLILSAKLLDRTRVEIIVCGVHTSAGVLAAVGVAACCAALAAMVLLFLERYELVFAALAVEAPFLAAWLVLGGGKAATCAL